MLCWFLFKINVEQLISMILFVMILRRMKRKLMWCCSAQVCLQEQTILPLLQFLKERKMVQAVKCSPRSVTRPSSSYFTLRLALVQNQFVVSEVPCTRTIAQCVEVDEDYDCWGFLGKVCDQGEIRNDGPGAPTALHDEVLQVGLQAAQLAGRGAAGDQQQNAAQGDDPEENRRDLW